jgi:flagellar biogenesis protein FliO
MFDTIMLIAFVLFMVFMVRGFMLQSQQKHRDRYK